MLVGTGETSAAAPPLSTPVCPPPLDQSRSLQDVVEIGRRARSLACYRRTQWRAGDRRRGRWRAPGDALPRTQKCFGIPIRPASPS